MPNGHETDKPPPNPAPNPTPTPKPGSGGKAPAGGGEKPPQIRMVVAAGVGGLIGGFLGSLLCHCLR
jgi:hypothetical protein